MSLRLNNTKKYLRDYSQNLLDLAYKEIERSDRTRSYKSGNITGAINASGSLKESLKLRRSIYVIKEIKKNEKFTTHNVWVKRPGTGKIPAKDLHKVINKKSKKELVLIFFQWIYLVKQEKCMVE